MFGVSSMKRRGEKKIFCLTSESMYGSISAFNQAEATASHLTAHSRAGLLFRYLDIEMAKGGSVPLFFHFCCQYIFGGGVFLSVRIV